MVYSKTAIVIASISIVLYITLSCVCAYYASKFWAVLQGRVKGGLYAQAKFVFFVVLGISSVLELPAFIGCCISEGQYECVWDEDGTHNFAWACHWIASCGFMYSVMSTAILWSDVLQQKDGNFFNTAHPLDKMKFRFRIAIVAYFLLVVGTLLVVFILEGAEAHSSSHDHSHGIGAVSYCLVPAILVVITTGCFGAGQRLQAHVISAQIDSVMLKKILFKLNTTLFCIFASYIIRALMLLSLYSRIPSGYSDTFKVTWHYSIWVPLTQWFPYIFCSFCLVDQMKFRAAPTRHESTTSNNLELGYSGSPSESQHEQPFSMESVSSVHSDLSLGVSNEGSKSALSYLVRNLETGRQISTDSVNSVNSINFYDTPLSDNYNLSNSHVRTLSADGQAAAAEAQHRGVGSTPIDHFFTTNALHSRANSIVAP